MVPVLKFLDAEAVLVCVCFAGKSAQSLSRDHFDIQIKVMQAESHMLLVVNEGNQC